MMLGYACLSNQPSITQQINPQSRGVWGCAKFHATPSWGSAEVLRRPAVLNPRSWDFSS